MAGQDEHIQSKIRDAVIAELRVKFGSDANAVALEQHAAAQGDDKAFWEHILRALT